MNSKPGTRAGGAVGRYTGPTRGRVGRSGSRPVVPATAKPKTPPASKPKTPGTSSPRVAATVAPRSPSPAPKPRVAAPVQPKTPPANKPKTVAKPISSALQRTPRQRRASLANLRKAWQSRTRGKGVLAAVFSARANWQRARAAAAVNRSVSARTRFGRSYNATRAGQFARRATRNSQRATRYSK